MSLRLRIAAACSVTLTALLTLAHDVRPGYLELRELSASNVAMLWRVPSQGSADAGAHLLLPAELHATAPTTVVEQDGWRTERSILQVRGILVGSTVQVEGLGDALSDALVRVVHVDGTEQVVRLTAQRTSFRIAATPASTGVAYAYALLGVEHILFGIDHLLFVLALVLLVRGRRKLFFTVTAFTLAHSITLAAATLGVVHVPSPPVEAIIALSIVFVALEIIKGREVPGLTAREPWIVAFTFGLLHGLGFAGALSEVGLPQQAVPVALLFFNIGVEAGQLAFIVCVLVIMHLLSRIFPDTGTTNGRATWAWRIPPYAIGGIASLWLIERILLF